MAGFWGMGSQQVYTLGSEGFLKVRAVPSFEPLGPNKTQAATSKGRPLLDNPLPHQPAHDVRDKKDLDKCLDARMQASVR